MLANTVASKLQLQWSPEQIARWPKQFTRYEDHLVSHETIYRSLYIQARGALKKELETGARNGGGKHRVNA